MKNILFLMILFGSTSARAQWTMLNSGTNEDLNEIYFPASDTGYAVGYNGTVIKTVDGGLTWEKLNTGLTVNFNDVYFNSTDDGWIVGESGSVCHTANGGSTWNCTQQDSAEFISLNSVYAINSSTVLIGGSRTWSDDFIAKTNDGGLTWQRAHVEKYVWDINIKKIGMVNDDIGYAITRGYVLKTIDGGLNWSITDTTSVHSGEMFHVLEDMAVFPENDTAYVCGWYGAYLGKTVDAGLQWQHHNDYQAYNLDFIDPWIGYVGGWCNLSKTIDGGNSFVDATGGDSDIFCNIYSIDFTDEWTGYACGHEGKIIKTVNGGTSAVVGNSISKSLINIYPNPSNDLINWPLEANAQLTSVTGKILAVSDHVKMMDLSDLPAGIYILTLYNEKLNFFNKCKVIKQ